MKANPKPYQTTPTAPVTTSESVSSSVLPTHDMTHEPRMAGNIGTGLAESGSALGRVVEVPMPVKQAVKHWAEGTEQHQGRQMIYRIPQEIIESHDERQIIMGSVEASRTYRDTAQGHEMSAQQNSSNVSVIHEYSRTSIIYKLLQDLKELWSA
ncbi:hypothetical protein E2C01_016201 [Portunus trituberculatus]|uniref:Uncharacterized protein n=1 Tax=Portunus trituberculatus TaxID=210409 RepID=A0A5B7DNG7_PORTR|nr:hypothetical protein [Portunus trituberculatus]